MRTKRTKNTKPLKSTILIYCDGVTEKCYLGSLKSDRYRGINIDIKPRLGSSDNFNNAFRVIGDILDADKDEQYKYIFYVKDMDTVHNQGVLDKFKRGFDKLSTTSRAKDILFLIDSRPCFEFWILLHFSGNDRLLNNYDEVEKELRRYLKDYEKTEKYSEKLYEKVKGNTSEAIHNSKLICTKQRVPGAEYSYTKVHRVFELLDPLIETTCT
jgi:hypothetical protein